MTNNQLNNTKILKVSIGNKLKKIKFPVDFADLQKNYNLTCFQYVDEDGDRITVDCKEDYFIFMETENSDVYFDEFKNKEVVEQEQAVSEPPKSEDAIKVAIKPELLTSNEKIVRAYNLRDLKMMKEQLDNYCGGGYVTYNEFPLLRQAIKDGESEFVNLLLDYDVNDLELISQDKNTIENIIFRNYVNVIKKLVEKKFKINDYALIVAAKNNAFDIMTLLISAGGNIDCVVKGDTPLAWAIFKCHFRIVKLLVSNGANINTTDSCHTSLLQLARSKNPEIMKYLIGNGADVNEFFGGNKCFEEYSIFKNIIDDEDYDTLKYILTKYKLVPRHEQ